jgi:D-sedoheptulose 7-phosphate isomerase
MIAYAKSYLADSLSVMQAACESPTLTLQCCDIASAIEKSMRMGGKVMLAGNGGSAGDAQHIAGEFLSRLNYDRAPLAGLALTTDTSAMLAIGNDYGFDKVFERQLLGLGKAGDVFIGISTSGKSPNVIAALKAARTMGIVTVGFCGLDSGPMGPLCDLALCAPSARTPMIQQIHITAAHIICGLVEEALFPRA